LTEGKMKSLKLISHVMPYIKYSNELSSQFPIVAYYCKYFAIQKGFEAIKKNPKSTEVEESKDLLMKELDACEALKKNLPPDTNKGDHRYVVENFVTSMFTKLDKEERTCETITKSLAVNFNKCSHFIILLNYFEDAYDATWNDRRQYCVYKAGSILKALK